MSKKSTNIGYDDTSYDTIDNWDYKKKRTFKKKKLQAKNFNVLFTISLILISIYIPLNYCIFNFNIPFNIDGKDESANRNFCQNSILYILNFKNIYVSSIFYISTFIAFIYILYISPVFSLINKYIIKPYLSYFIGCSYEYLTNLRDTVMHIDVLIKEKQYAKLYDLFCKFMILLIALLFFIAFSLFASLTMYNYFYDDDLSIDNIEERVEKFSDIINDTEIPLVDIDSVVKKL